jgi:hypothetical protein
MEQHAQPTGKKERRRQREKAMPEEEDSSSPGDQRVRDLGRKARARLETLRSQRHEVQRLEELPETKKPAAEEDKEGGEKSEAVAEKKSSTKATPARKRKRRASKAAATGEDEDVDRWMPDTSHVPVCSRETQSRVVQVHGLPVSSTVADIRRFFSGLSCQHVYLLTAPTKNRKLLGDWDALHEQGKPEVPRYDPTMRVFVQFESAPAAALAAQRSGEVMVSMAADSTRRVCVAVTQVRKPLAPYLVKHLAFPAASGVPLEEMLQSLQEQLDPVVPHILWTAAVKELQLNVEAAEGENVVDFDLEGPRVELYPQEHLQYETLSKHRNKLLKQLDKLLYAPPLTPADPTLEETGPFIRLTNAAIRILQTEIHRIDDRLSTARRWQLFQAEADRA